MAKVKWIIAVVPPAQYGEPFDIPEWSYNEAYKTHRRYQQRGWQACIVRGDEARVPWFVRGFARGRWTKLDELQVMARSSDEALMLARRKDPDYDETQRA